MLIRFLCTAVAMIASLSEPGERLVLKGQLFDPSGKRPVAGVTIHAYHTDAKGLYDAPGKDGHRLSANVTTDREGRFEFQTIRPASYPGLNSPPAHIHLQAWGAGYPKQGLEAIEFADDPRLPPAERAKAAGHGRFSGLVTPKKDAKGVWRASVNLKLRMAS